MRERSFSSLPSLRRLPPAGYSYLVGLRLDSMQWCPVQVVAPHLHDVPRVNRECALDRFHVVPHPVVGLQHLQALHHVRALRKHSHRTRVRMFANGPVFSRLGANRVVVQPEVRRVHRVKVGEEVIVWEPES